MTLNKNFLFFTFWRKF